MKTSIGIFITGLHLVIICFLFEVHSATVKLNCELRPEDVMRHSECAVSYLPYPVGNSPTLTCRKGLREGQII